MDTKCKALSMERDKAGKILGVLRLAYFPKVQIRDVYTLYRYYSKYSTASDFSRTVDTLRSTIEELPLAHGVQKVGSESGSF